MALAPTIVVPIFVMVNVCVAIRLIQKEKLRKIRTIETVPAAVAVS